jgi:hypothetical protein
LSRQPRAYLTHERRDVILVMSAQVDLVRASARFHDAQRHALCIRAHRFDPAELAFPDRDIAAYVRYGCGAFGEYKFVHVVDKRRLTHRLLLLQL